MAFDATRAVALEIPEPPVAAADEFDGSARLAVLVGAFAAGAMAGAALALAFGRFDAIYANTAVALVCAVAAYLAGRTFLEFCDSGRPAGAVLVGFHVMALIAMPIALQLVPQQASLGVYAAFATLILFAATLRLPRGAVARMSAHAALLTLAAAYQGLYALMI